MGMKDAVRMVELELGGLTDGLFSVRSRDGTGDPFLILADPARCPLNPIFDGETENAGFTSSKVRFGELRLENGLFGPVFEHLRPVTTNVDPSRHFLDPIYDVETEFTGRRSSKL